MNELPFFFTNMLTKILKMILCISKSEGIKYSYEMVFRYTAGKNVNWPIFLEGNFATCMKALKYIYLILSLLEIYVIK